MVPHAVDVAVIIGSEWVMLKKDEEDTWHGEADVAKVSGTSARVAVCAAYEGSADSYSTLLEYTA